MLPEHVSRAAPGPLPPPWGALLCCADGQDGFNRSRVSGRF